MARSLDKLQLPADAVLSVSLTCTVLRYMDPVTILRISLTSLVHPRWKFAPVHSQVLRATCLVQRVA